MNKNEVVELIRIHKRTERVNNGECFINNLKYTI